MLNLFHRPASTWLVDTKHEDPRRVFRLTDGNLEISGEGFGYWRTVERFRDFRLAVEFKWGRQVRRTGCALDSGVFIHTQGPDGNSHDGNGAFIAGIEINIFQAATGDFLLIRGDDAEGRPINPRLTAQVAPQRDADGWFTWQRGGNALSLEKWGRLNWSGKSRDWRDVENFRGEHDIEKPPGEWNYLEIESLTGRLRVWLNRTPVNEALATWPEDGHIAFQCEGAQIWFRNARVDVLQR